MNFLADYLQVIDKNISNDYKDNWDHNRYGPEPTTPLRRKLLDTYLKLLNKKGYLHLHSLVSHDLADILKFQFLYETLETDADRELLLLVIAYRMMGHRKIKLPLNTPEYWRQLESLSGLVDDADALNPKFLHFSLRKIRLEKIGYPIEFYFTEGGTMIDFIVKQYEYNKNGKIIKVESGDIVIDGGGCWGDTALYFANETGINGKVFSFEFIPNNLQIFERNLSLNEHLKNTIELIKRPIWSDSSTNVNYKDFGPGSTVSLDPFPGQDGEITTLSIDDLVTQKELNKVDFLKLDIEGAEMNALQGAARTIKRFKPKLAVALYHSVDDFEKIPRMIRELAPDYRFYFSHCTIFAEESVLFAIAD